MTELSNEVKYLDAIEMGAKHQSKLFAIYKSSIGLINDLRKESKLYMNLLSDVEDGLLSTSEDSGTIESNLALLTKNIISFNDIIGDKCDAFTTSSEQMLQEYELACSLYEAKDGQLSKILEVRKQLLFILALIRKYKHKINSLQLTNNVLFSLSQDLKEAKEAYKSNLIYVSTAMTYVIEQIEERIECIENLN